MTRSGLLRAAQILAHDDAWRHDLRASVSRPVTERHVEDLRRPRVRAVSDAGAARAAPSAFCPTSRERGALRRRHARGELTNLPFRMVTTTSAGC
jgi:hypothetical protein